MTHTLPAGQRLRDAWRDGPVQIPGVFCPLVARLAEQLGFRAVYLSGAALSASLGLPDVGLITQTEFADEAARIVRATTLPLLCDANPSRLKYMKVQVPVARTGRTDDELKNLSFGEFQI